MTPQAGLPTEPVGDSLLPRQAATTWLGDNGYPDMVARFEVRDGRPECVEVRVVAKPGGRGITAADLALLNPDGMARSVMGEFAMRRVGTDGGPVAVWAPAGSERDAWAVSGDTARAQGRRRTGKVTTAELEKVAEVYRAHLDGHPAQAVERLLGYGSQRTAARRIKAAEAAGLLPATTAGKRRGR